MEARERPLMAGLRMINLTETSIATLDQRFTTEKRKRIVDSLCQAIYVIRDTLTEEII